MSNDDPSNYFPYPTKGVRYDAPPPVPDLPESGATRYAYDEDMEDEDMEDEDMEDEDMEDEDMWDEDTGDEDIEDEDTEDEDMEDSDTGDEDMGDSDTGDEDMGDSSSSGEEGDGDAHLDDKGLPIGGTVEQPAASNQEIGMPLPIPIFWTPSYNWISISLSEVTEWVAF
jgi:hypothetical protein